MRTEPTQAEIDRAKRAQEDWTRPGEPNRHERRAIEVSERDARREARRRLTRPPTPKRRCEAKCRAGFVEADPKRWARPNWKHVVLCCGCVRSLDPVELAALGREVLGQLFRPKP